MRAPTRLVPAPAQHRAGRHNVLSSTCVTAQACTCRAYTTGSLCRPHCTGISMHCAAKIGLFRPLRAWWLRRCTRQPEATGWPKCPSPNLCSPTTRWPPRCARYTVICWIAHRALIHHHHGNAFARDIAGVLPRCWSRAWHGRTARMHRAQRSCACGTVPSARGRRGSWCRMRQTRLTAWLSCCFSAPCTSVLLVLLM